MASEYVDKVGKWSPYPKFEKETLFGGSEGGTGSVIKAHHTKLISLGTRFHSPVATENQGALVTRSQQARILLSTSLAAFIIIGFTQSFGVFQVHYESNNAVQAGVLRHSETSSRGLISSIGSFSNGGIVALFAVVYYPHLPRIGAHIRSLCCIGSALIVLGLAMAGLCRNLVQLFVCQGLIQGVGAGILLYLLTPILPEYFPERSGLAQGTMFAAAALGGMTFSFANTALLEHLGVRKTLFVLAGISAGTLSVASALALPPRKFEKRDTKIVHWKVFKDPLFSSLFLVNLIHPLTLAIPMAFGPDFAKSLGIDVTKASYLLAINSGVGIPSRLGAGALADKIGHQNTLLIATAVYVLATWGLWLPSALKGNVGLYIAMSVCHGLVNGVFNTVMNSAQKALFGEETYYPKNGAMTTIRGLGYMVGIPIAGVMVRDVAVEQLGGVDFMPPIVYVGMLLTFSLACLLNVRRLDAIESGWHLVR
ncbi:major facilitator superfamily domain-containing protein [Paraphoma chrysanthemicola]|nr:major facilitator superfamily domain-containing protein [Paraphoma chrysanthemicola]